jgi:hypothetical protein
MFSNTGDSSRPDTSTEGGVCLPFPSLYIHSFIHNLHPSLHTNVIHIKLKRKKQVGGTFSNTSDPPSRAPGAGMFSNDSDAPQTSAGYDNNVDAGGEREGKKKHGLLSKVKEAFVPKPGSIGRTGNEDLVSPQGELGMREIANDNRREMMLQNFILRGMEEDMNRRIGI